MPARIQLLSLFKGKTENSTWSSRRREAVSWVTGAVRTRSLRMRFLKSTNVFALGVLVALGLEGSAGQGKQSSFPEAPGKAVVKKLCGTCHEVEAVIASRRTRIGWERSVDDMIARGAKGSDDEMDAVVEYLATYFGKTNVNT